MGQTFELENVDKSKIGFFLIPNGDNANAGLKDGQSVSFEKEENGRWSPVLEGKLLKGQQGAPLYSNTNLNKLDYEYSRDSKAEGNQNW